MTSDCGNHGYGKFNRKTKLVLIGIGGFCIMFGVTVLIVHLYRPIKPSFSLQDASILNLNLTSSTPTFLTSTFQVTLFSRNPNGRVGIYYEKLDVYASYEDQQITMSTSLPSSYQATDGDVSIWSSYIYGDSIPIAPYIATSLAQQAQGSSSGLLLLINVRVDGKVRWTVGSWRSRLYHINVDCPAVFGYYSPTAEIFNGSTSSLTPASSRLRQISSCRVEV